MLQFLTKGRGWISLEARVKMHCVLFFLGVSGLTVGLMQKEKTPDFQSHPQNDQLPMGLLAQLVKHHTGIAEGMGVTSTSLNIFQVLSLLLKMSL